MLIRCLSNKKKVSKAKNEESHLHQLTKILYPTANLSFNIKQDYYKVWLTSFSCILPQGWHCLHDVPACPCRFLDEPSRGIWGLGRKVKQSKMLVSWAKPSKWHVIFTHPRCSRHVWQHPGTPQNFGTCVTITSQQSHYEIHMESLAPARFVSGSLTCSSCIRY